MTTRILLCDDHPIVRDGLRTLLNSQDDFQLVGEAADGLTAVELAKQLQPDVVVMDMSLPKLNGALATQQIKAVCPQTQVIALTVHDDKSYLRQFLEAGAAGYVLKSTASSELIEAIRMVASGQNYLDPAMNQAIVSRLVRRPRSSELAGGAPLSEREEQVVQLLAQGFTNKEIAKQLTVSVKTVETYKSRALEKLDLRSRADLVRYAVQKGWLSDSGNIGVQEGTGGVQVFVSKNE